MTPKRTKEEILENKKKTFRILKFLML